MVKDNSRSQYQATLERFGLKQKPINHYFEHGVIKFNVHEGELHYTTKLISKSLNGTLYTGIIKSRERLDKLLATKTLTDVQHLELVIQ